MDPYQAFDQLDLATPTMVVLSLCPAGGFLDSLNLHKMIKWCFLAKTSGSPKKENAP